MPKEIQPDTWFTPFEDSNHAELIVSESGHRGKIFTYTMRLGGEQICAQLGLSVVTKDSRLFIAQYLPTIFFDGEEISEVRTPEILLPFLEKNPLIVDIQSIQPFRAPSSRDVLDLYIKFGEDEQNIYLKNRVWKRVAPNIQEEEESPKLNNFWHLLTLDPDALGQIQGRYGHLDKSLRY